MNDLNLENYLTGFIQKKETKRGTQFLRFYDEQLEVYRTDIIHQTASMKNAGMAIVMETNADKLSLEYDMDSLGKVLIGYGKQIIYYWDVVKWQMTFQKKLKAAGLVGEQAYKGDGATGSSFDLIVNGDHIENILCKKGTTIFNLNNPDHAWKRIELFLPYERTLYFKKISVDGEAIPIKRDCYLALGDSITHGGNNYNSGRAYVAQVSRGLNLELLNMGVPGYVFNKESLNGMEKLPFIPRVITVAYGTNDWMFKESRAVAEKDMTEYFGRLHELFPEVKTYVITPLWRADEDEVHKVGNMDSWRECIASEASKYENITVIKGDELIPHEYKYFQDNILHPNDVGSDFYAAKLMSIINP